jgi:PadR family transcriptional regulator PadR
MDDDAPILDKWRSQIRKGFLELCVLASIESIGDSCGLDLMESLSRAGLEVSEGTIYPLLMRMIREGSLEATWEIPERGHPRKYYRLSSAGGRALSAMRKEYEAGFASYRSLGAKEEAR